MANEDFIRNDEAARWRIVHELDTTFLVEAGAGSGKTTSLVARMLSLIASGKAEVSQIAAITFTKKAAAELRGRFRIKLEQQLRELSDETVRLRLKQALEHIAECFIGTIHSFCGKLLRERPMEARIDPQFAEMDEKEFNDCLNRHWDDYLLELREQGREDGLDGLTNNGVNVEDLRTVFLTVAHYEDVSVVTQTVARPNFDLIRSTLLPLIDESVRYMPINRPDGGWDALQQIVRLAMSALRSWDMGNELRVLHLAAMFDKTLNVTQKRWPDGQMAKELMERYAQWRSEVLIPFMQSWREYLHPQLVDFVLPAVEYSRRRRLEEGVLSFQDLLMRAADLLREQPEVRRYFSKRYTRLLVDEFQDTDPVQAEMLLLLTGSITHENDWRKQAPTPGSLFIVGDPKQSIYRFRRADISTYNFVKRLVSGHGDILQLTRNFRSVKSVGDFVNYAFESKFLPPTRTDDHQASFVKMLTNRDNPKGKGLLHGVYTMTCPKMKYDRKADIASYDAERTARWIAWAVSGNLRISDDGGRDSVRPVRPDDFMILLKHREFIGLYAEMLEHYGIPADTSGSRVMYDEIRALHLLAVCLNDPTDRIPLLGVLRGLLFGVSDEVLCLYKREIGHITLFPPQTAVSEKARAAYDALVRLRDYLDLIRRKPAFAAFMEIIEDLGIIPYAAVQTAGTIRSGTVVKLLEMIGEHTKAIADWDGLTKLLERIVKTNGIEGTSLFTGSGHMVRIMNLHKAKGLEAPVVFLACPSRNHDPDATEHIDRMTDPAQGYFTISRKKDVYNNEVLAQPVGWPELAEKERLYTHAERDRLLYVAATRAKQLLIISQYPTKPAIDPWSELSVALKMQPELDDVRMDMKRPERYAGEFDVNAALAAWNERKEAAAEATYSVTNVTAQAKSGEEYEALTRPNGGRGAAFGTVVHRCLEALGNGLQGERLEAYLRMAALEKGLEEKWHNDALSMVALVAASDIWKRAAAARQRFHEFTFTTAASVDGRTRILSGVIDLVFQEEEGWVIVDFKTDAFEWEHKECFVRCYAPQVAAYAEYWQRLGNGRVKEAGLLFLNHNRYVTVGIPSYTKHHVT